MTEADLDSINNKEVSLHLLYKSVCESSKVYLLPIDEEMYFVPNNMRPQGRIFVGSDSMFTTHQHLAKRVGQAVWFTEFTPAKIVHLGFVNRLLHTFCELDIQGVPGGMCQTSGGYSLC